VRKTLATLVLFALTLLPWIAQAQQSQTQPAAPQKGTTAKWGSGTGKKMTQAAKAPFGEMAEEAGCKIMNKGKRGQICFYDVTPFRPETQAALAPDKPIYISERKHETLMWHKGGGMGFHVTGIELRAGQNPHCPKQAFDNDFKDDDAEEWHDVISSGMPNHLAALYQCEYKTHFKWKDGKRGDPHIIIGDPTTP